MKRIISILLLIVVTGSSYACSLCGCSASSQYLGILPQFSWNFVGFQYQYNSFSGTHPSLFENKPDEHSGSYYNTMQIFGRYNIGKRYQLFAFAPYRFNTYRGTDTNTSSNGIGDVSVIMNRVFIRRNNKNWKYLLLGGVGIKLPTGKNVGISTLDRMGLPNIQSGTGSWDFLVDGNYTISHKRTGLNIDAAYTITTANKYGYKYGNKLSTGMLVFHSFNDKKVTLLPLAGIQYEYSLHDYDNYKKRWLNDQSGGYLCYATAEFQIYYKRLGFRIACHLPVSQNYSAGDLQAGIKSEASLFVTY